MFKNLVFLLSILALPSFAARVVQVDELRANTGNAALLATSTQLSYLAGVTANIQTQINNAGGGGSGPFKALVFKGDAGFGSTNLAIRYFTTVDTTYQSDFVFDNSATDGLSVTVPDTAVYALTILLRYDQANDMGLSVNATGSELNSTLSLIPFNKILTFGSSVIDQHTSVSVPDIVLQAGDVVRVQTIASETATAPQFSYFRISKVRSLP